MQCPKCNSFHTQVVKTIDNDRVVIRYRKCRVCNHNFKTIEILHSVYTNLKELPDELEELIEKSKK